MRVWGICLVILGAIWIVISFNMETSVQGYGINRIENIGLIAERQNHLLVASLITLIGSLMTIFGSKMNDSIGIPVSAPEATSLTTTPSPANRARPENRSLKNVQYRLWLVSEYGIERNDILGEFICNDESFKTIDAALKFADEAEKSKKLEAKNTNTPNTQYLSVEASELGITFDGEIYHYKAYRYQSLKDALAYARREKD